jgi:hypothetical protein
MRGRAWGGRGGGDVPSTEGAGSDGDVVKRRRVARRAPAAARRRGILAEEGGAGRGHVVASYRWIPLKRASCGKRYGRICGWAADEHGAGPANAGSYIRFCLAKLEFGAKFQFYYGLLHGFF